MGCSVGGSKELILLWKIKIWTIWNKILTTLTNNNSLPSKSRRSSNTICSSSSVSFWFRSFRKNLKKPKNKTNDTIQELSPIVDSYNILMERRFFLIKITQKILIKKKIVKKYDVRKPIHTLMAVIIINSQLNNLWQRTKIYCPWTWFFGKRDFMPEVYHSKIFE